MRWGGGIERRAVSRKNMLGESNLAKIHRLTASGPVEKGLSLELKEVEALFFAAGFIVAD